MKAVNSPNRLLAEKNLKLDKYLTDVLAFWQKIRRRLFETVFPIREIFRRILILGSVHCITDPDLDPDPAPDPELFDNGFQDNKRISFFAYYFL
jgi:hypothetical protein